MSRIGIALSGGGHRAAMFSLGVLLYLVDAGKNRAVTSISSVSGGSLTNGFVAVQETPYDEAADNEFRRTAAQFAHQIATRGTVFASVWTCLYLVLAAALVIPLGIFWYQTLDWTGIGLRLLRLGIALALVAIWWKLVVSQRGRVCGYAFGRTLFSPKGRPALLSSIHSSVDHVFCATELHAGEHAYFSKEFVYNYRFGLGDSGKLPLHRAVQASAAFPGGFPPRVILSKPRQFVGGRNQSPFMVLSDGGVYDNMAEQWGWGLSRRKDRLARRAKKEGVPALEERSRQWKGLQQLLVVNASARLGWKSMARHSVPLLGELLALLDIVNTLYDNTTRPRRKALFAMFTKKHKGDYDLEGCMITIDQDPFRVIHAVRRDSDLDEPTRARAEETLRALGDTEACWRHIAEQNKAVPTTLRKLGVKPSATLMYHGYVMAMVNTHLFLNYPLLDLPDLDNFVKLARGQPSP